MIRRPFTPNVSDQTRRARVYCDYPGYFAVRLIKGGPEVGLRILHEATRDPETGETLDRSFYYRTVLNGHEFGEPSIQPPAKLWIGREISETEYRYLLEDRRWAAEHAPHLPEAQPDKRADLRTMGAIKP